MKKYFPLCSAVSSAVSLTVSSAVIASALVNLLAALPAAAATFAYQETNSVVGENVPPTISESGNVRTIINAAVRTNPSSTATEEIIFLVPFLWTGINNNFVGLSWENSLNAWTNDNYDGLGNAVTVALANATQRVRLGDLADLTGQAPLPLSIPCNNSPSCSPDLPPFIPPLSQDSEDVVPFLSFGRFAPGETKALDAVFSFTYEDTRTGTLPLFPAFGTFSAIAAQPVPEPTPAPTLALIAIGAALLKHKKYLSHKNLG